MDNFFNGYIEDSRDALIIIEATKLGIFKLTKDRLNHIERRFIKPGSCFVWKQDKFNLQRWTDGKSWSASKYSKGFFYYLEKEKKKSQNNSLYSIYNKSKNELIKKTFTVNGLDNQKYQLINYIYKNNEKNLSLIKPKQIYFQSLNSFKDEYYPSSHILSPIIISNDNKDINNENSNVTSNDDNSNNIKTLECEIDQHLYHLEDLRQLSLLPIQL